MKKKKKITPLLNAKTKLLRALKQNTKANFLNWTFFSLDLIQNLVQKKSHAHRACRGKNHMHGQKITCTRACESA